VVGLVESSGAYQAVLIDLYSTLVWSNWSRWQDTLADRLGITPQELGRAFEETRPARSVGAYPHPEGDIEAVVKQLGMDATPELVGGIRELEEREILQDIHLYEDSLPTVRELRARGIATALVSNCSNNTRAVVERLGLPQEFDQLILSFEVGSRKPEPRIYEVALERLEVTQPARAMFVDDQPEYCEGAVAIGIQSVLIVRPGSESPQDPGDLTTISGLAELL
jgi:putative hydrolase of the HAD superfamily